MLRFRNRTAAPHAAPGAWTTAILLRGWNAPRPPGTTPEDERAVRALWARGPASHRELAQLWRRHEAYLRAEAERLGIAPMFSRSGARFFGEYVAIGIAEAGQR